MSKKVQSEQAQLNAPASAPATSSLPRETLLAHFKALRNMLVISAIAVGIAFLVIFLGFSQPLMSFLRQPLTDRGVMVVYTALAESLTTQMKAAFVVGFIIASPVVIWQVWKFLKPALYPQEGKVFISLFFVAVLLFLIGTVFAYIIVFNMAISFFLISGEGIATPMISIDSYVNFMFGFILPFGLMFELPIAMTILANMGILKAASAVKARKFVVFAIFVVAAILTPPDVISQVCLGVPLVILYEAGIIAARMAEKKRERKLANDES